MRARTIGQIAALMATHMGGTAPTASASPVAAPAITAEPGTAASEIDFDALSSDEIDRLIGDEKNSLIEATPHV